MSLFTFLWETIRPRANDPANARFWLPGVLAGIERPDGQGKLLPLVQPRWDLGPITGSTGATISKSFADNWATYLQKVQHVDLSHQYPIASPSSPNPVLTLGGDAGPVVVNGLDNLYVQPAQAITPTATGYELALVLQLGYYDGSKGRPTRSPLTIDAPYTLAQQLCTSSDGVTCNGNYENSIVGGGTVSIAITNAWIYATLEVGVAGAGTARAPTVQLTKVRLSGATPGSDPDLAIQSLTIDARVSSYLRTVWVTLATNALESPDGRAGIFASMNTQLNQPGFLASLTATLTSQCATMLDSLLGPGLAAPAGGGLNPADAYLYDRVRFALDAPGSSWYLPRILCNLEQPPLDPLKIASIGLPDITVAGLTFTAVTLTDVVLVGLTNLETPSDQVVFNDTGVAWTAHLGAIANPPPVPCACGGHIPAPPARATAQFSMSTLGQPLTGSVSVTVTDGLLAGQATAIGVDVSQLAITVTSLAVQMPVLADLVISVDIDSAFQDLVNSVINQPGPQQAILDALNQQLTGQLGTVSTQVTAYAKAAIAAQLS